MKIEGEVDQRENEKKALEGKLDPVKIEIVGGRLTIRRHLRQQKQQRVLWRPNTFH
jgi:hypothetical protein